MKGVGIEGWPLYHFERVGRHCVFGAGFFVFAVAGFEEAVCPGVPMIPVEHTGDGEVWVECGWVGDIPDESINPGHISREPCWVESADYGGGIDEVAVTMMYCQYELGTI